MNLGDTPAVPRSLPRAEEIRAAALDAEAARIRAIFNSPAGLANPTAASHFAFETDLPADAAITEMTRMAGEAPTYPEEN